MFLCVNTCPDIFGVVSMLKLHGVLRRFISLSRLGSFIRMLTPVRQMYCHLESLPTVTTFFAIMQSFLGRQSFQLFWRLLLLRLSGCIALGNIGHFKGLSRHIDLRYMFLSDYIARGLVKFERVDS